MAKDIYTVLGARSFNDTIEGQKHDFTKLSVVMENPERGTTVGWGAVEIQWGDHSNLEKLKHIPIDQWPLKVELDIKLTTKGYEIAGVNLQSKAPAPAKAA